MATHFCQTAGEFTTALNTCVAGDIISLDHTVTFVGNFVVKNRGAINPANPIIIQGDGTGLPAEGSRIHPDDSAQLPKLQQTQQTNLQNVQALRFEAGANGYILRLVEFVGNQFGASEQCAIGTNDSGQTTYAQQPENIVVDRCLFRGGLLTGQKAGIAIHGKNITLKGSWFDRYGGVGQDSVPVYANNGEGPLLVENNYIQPASYAFITGGSDVRIKTVATVTASPAPTGTQATVSTVDALSIGQHVAILYTDPGLPGLRRHHAYITNIDAPNLRITWDTAIPSSLIPDVPGDIRWGCQMTDITFTRNHCARPATYINPILGDAPVLTSGPTAVAGAGLTAGTYYYRVRGRAVDAGYLQADLFTSGSTEASVVTSGGNLNVSLTWGSVTNATSYYVYRYQKDGAGATINGNRFTVTGATTFTDTGAAGTSFTGSVPAGTKWVIKNIFELKHGVDVQVDSNVMEYSWIGSDIGQCVWLKSNNQSDSHEFAQCKNIVFENNLLRHIEGSINISGIRSSNDGKTESYPERMSNILVRNNLIYDSTAARNVMLSGGSDDVTFDHNTFIHTNHSAMELGPPSTKKGSLTNHAFTNNIFVGNTFGIWGSLGEGKTMMDDAAPSCVFDDNVLSNRSSANYNFAGATNYFPVTATFEAQFKDYGGPDPEDYKLKRLSEGDDIDSLYINAGSDGADLGCDIDELLTAISGVETGEPPGEEPPPPDPGDPVRVYFPSTSAAVTLDTLTPSAAWTTTTQMTRLLAVVEKTNTAFVDKQLNSTSAAPEYHCAVQYHIYDLAAQTIDGTLKGQIRAYENSDFLAGTLAISARVVSQDGTTLRGYLIGTEEAVAAPLAATVPPEFSTTPTVTNRKFMDTQASASIVMTPVATQDRDVLIIEVGIRDNSSNTTRIGYLRLGDALSDLPEDDTTTTEGAGWVEFSNGFTFSPNPGDPDPPDPEPPPATAVGAYICWQSSVM